jgi:hypothetical protein
LYKIKGELHHVTGTLLPSLGQTPMYSQLYIHDPDSALNHRMANRNNLTLDRGTMQTLQDMLYRHHISVQLYRQAYEITRDPPQDQDCTIALRFDSACDKRRYNLPSAASREIAVIIPGSGEEHRDVRDIVLWRRGGGLKLKRINELSPLHQSLHFVLLFPTGQFGWNPKLELTLGGQNDAPDEDNDAQLLEPGEEPPPEGEVVAVRKKRKYMSQIEYFAQASSSPQ